VQSDAPPDCFIERFILGCFGLDALPNVALHAVIAILIAFESALSGHYR